MLCATEVWPRPFCGTFACQAKTPAPGYPQRNFPRPSQGRQGPALQTTSMLSLRAQTIRQLQYENGRLGHLQLFPFCVSDQLAAGSCRFQLTIGDQEMACNGAQTG